MPFPSPSEQLEIRQVLAQKEVRALWRPRICPHHTSSAVALVGGGVPPRPGDAVRAHRGQLVLDELLEFDQKAQAALREPIEKGQLIPKS